MPRRWLATTDRPPIVTSAAPRYADTTTPEYPVFMRFFDHPADALLQAAARTRVPSDLGTARAIRINATSVLLAGAPGAVATIARRMPRAARAELDEFRLADVYAMITDPRYVAGPAMAR